MTYFISILQCACFLLFETVTYICWLLLYWWHLITERYTMLDTLKFFILGHNYRINMNFYFILFYTPDDIFIFFCFLILLVYILSYISLYQETYKEGVNRCLVDTCLHVQREEKGENDIPWLTDDMIRAVILDTIGGGKRSLAQF